MIVGSILLAFAIDAGWQRIQEDRDAVESLELIRRDLHGAIDQLDEFSRLAEQQSGAALNAFEALSHPDGIDAEEVRSQLQLTGERRTIALPSAAYTDLVSTGQLRTIRNRALRDQIVRFYESAQRVELILEKNNSVFIDQHIFGMWAEGLLLFRPEGTRFTPSSRTARDAVAKRLGEDFDYGPDYLWSLPRDSPEWHRVKGRLTLMAMVMLGGQDFARQIIGEAEALLAAIEVELR